MSEMSEDQGRSLAICLGILVVTLAICVLILFYDRKNAANLDAEGDNVESEVEVYDGQADEVCGQRLTQYTNDGVLDLEQFLYSYGYKPTESGWVGEEGVLNFDYSKNDSKPIIRFDTGEKKYKRQTSVTSDDTVDCVRAQIGVKKFTMSRDDMTAIGRIIIGITDDFETEE